MAVLCRDKKLLFILNPRTGSSALGDHLIKEFGGEWIPAEIFYHNKLKKKIYPKHNTLDELVEANLLEDCKIEDHHIFTSTSNPYDSLLTLYNKYRYRYDEWRKEGRPFLQNSQAEKEINFCKNHSVNQWIFKRYSKAAIKALLGIEEYSVNQQYLKGCRFVLKKESLQKDFSMMLDDLEIEGNRKIPISNRTEKKGDWSAELSYFSRILIYITYRKDFKRFNYPF